MGKRRGWNKERGEGQMGGKGRKRESGWVGETEVMKGIREKTVGREDPSRCRGSATAFLPLVFRWSRSS